MSEVAEMLSPWPAWSRCAVEVKEGTVAESLRSKMSTLELNFEGCERTCCDLARKVNLEPGRETVNVYRVAVACDTVSHALPAVGEDSKSELGGST